jgi:hypothetical protein
MRWGPIAIAGMVVGAFVAYSLAYPTTSYRFRITLNVDTPNGLKTGSSVMEVRTRRYPAWTTLGQSNSTSRLTGDAIFLDLGPDAQGETRNVVSLLTSGPRGELVSFDMFVSRAFAPWWRPAQKSDNFRGAQWELSKLPVGTAVDLQGDLLPTLISFARLNDPKTARAVHPGDFPRVFGQGITFRDARLEIVPAGIWPFRLLGLGGEPVTRGIENKLPWWNNPGRPAVEALRAAGLYLGESELAFRWN